MRFLKTGSIRLLLFVHWFLIWTFGLVETSISTRDAASCLGGEPIEFGSKVDFDTEIIPILTRSGCNVGSCHGSAAGRGGFRLSLLGGDPAFDYAMIVSQYEGRRIHRVTPDRSLLFLKPTMQIDHEGGEVLEKRHAETVLRWIAQGARRLHARELDRFEVVPNDLLFHSLDQPIALQARAIFQDGTTEEVTDRTVFTSQDPDSVTIDGSNHATIKRRGPHTIIARYLDRVTPIRLAVPFHSPTVPSSQAPKEIAPNPSEELHWIDREVEKVSDRLGLTPAPLADDAIFLRRIYLDLTGRLPQRSEIETFLSNRSPNKRLERVDQLLLSDPFLDFWSYRFAKLLRIQPQPNDREAAKIYHGWVRNQIQQNVGLDQIAKSLMTEVGDTHQNAPANFSRNARDPRAQAELISQAFMGTRLQCANCHNHPLDRWTQEDYHGLAAVFARLDRGPIVRVERRGIVTNPKTGEPAKPRIPGVRDLEVEQDQRMALADWLVSKENPHFATSMVNRLWRDMMGRGLVDPVDDLRSTNPATHPVLLRLLAEDFVENGFQIRRTLRTIASSHAYARRGQAEQGLEREDRFYSYRQARDLEPEVLADAICDVTGVHDQYGTEPLGTRAVSLFDPLTPSESLDVLGRCSRRDTCEGDSTRGTLPAKLHQLNGPLVNRKVASQDGLLHKMLVDQKGDEEIVGEFYLRALCRLPTSEENSYWLSQAKNISNEERGPFWEDFVWGLLNCREFQTNH